MVEKELLFEAGQIAMCWYPNQYNEVDLFYCKILSLNGTYATCQLFGGKDEFDPEQIGRTVNDVCIADLLQFDSGLFNPVEGRKKYVVLEHLTLPDRGFRFWSTNSDKPEKVINGMAAYRVIKFTDDEDEAILLSGKCTPSLVATMRELEDFYSKK